MSQSSDKAINILLLGETGSGKSTTLNALTNYLKFDGDYKKALDSSNEMVELVKTLFILPHPETGAPITICSGGDDNEQHNSGFSATKAPISYKFNFEQDSIRIIDTPGIGDTCGTQEDERNFDRILLHLQAHQKLNAIVIIVRNSDSRSTSFFKYCITQLMLHLHKSVTANIIFCFTHSRSSMFGPGDGYRTLQAFLENGIKEANLKLVPGQNCFFIDNDSYRILVAKKNKYPLDEDMEMEYRSSWNRSARQVKNMLHTIISLPPHNLIETVSLNQASKIILELVQPMIQMQATIKKNIEVIDENRLKHLNLNDLVNTKIWDLHSKQLEMPSTVCANCFTRVDDKIIYRTCHENCYCIFVADNANDQFMLRLCTAMDWNSNCKNCKCSFREHKHISYKYEQVKRPGIDEKKLFEINQAPNEIKKIEMALNVLEAIQKEFETERNVIQDISAKFGYLLSNNSYFSHNKIFEDYIQSLIDEEIKKEYPNVEPLKRLLRDHEDGVRNLTDAVRQKITNPVRLEEIPVLKQQLLYLKHNGENFRQILETNERINVERFKYQEKKISFVIKIKSFFGNLFSGSDS